MFGEKNDIISISEEEGLIGKPDLINYFKWMEKTRGDGYNYSRMGYIIDIWLLLLCIIIYLKVLTPCVKDPNVCMEEINYPQSFVLIMLYSGIEFYVIKKSIRNKEWVKCVLAVAIFVILSFKDPGTSFDHKGTFVKWWAYSTMTLILLFYGLLKLGLKLQKEYCSSIYKCLSCTIFIILAFTYLTIKYSKRNWGKGFNNVWLDTTRQNIDAECKLIDYTFPNYDLGIYLMLPMHLMFRTECNKEASKQLQELLFFDKKYNEDPINNNYQVYPDNYRDITFDEYEELKILPEFFLNNVKFFKDKSDFKADYWVNFEDKANPYLEIDIQEKNFTSESQEEKQDERAYRSRSRPQKIDTNQTEEFKNLELGKGKMNIMLLMFDAISRQQFFRSFPKTAAYLEKFYSTKPDSPQNLSSKGFQFFRGQSFVGYTVDNLVNLRYGHINFIWNKPMHTKSLTHIANENGYITSYSSGLCSMYEAWKFNSVKIQKDYTDYTMADHVSLGISCDPIYYNPNQIFGLLRGPFSITPRCFFKENLSNQLFRFILDFHKKYKGKAHYSFNQFMDGHEFTTMVPQYIDEDLRDFLMNLEKEKILDDTLVLLYSDHGQHMTPFNLVEQGRIERNNWFSHMLYPKKFLTTEMENYLLENSQRLISHFDLHKMLLKVITGKKEQDITEDDIEEYNLHYAYDLSHQEIPNNRSCEHLTSDLYTWCICDGNQ